MSTKSNSLAKSLHTVSVIVAIARYQMASKSSARDAVWSALTLLGYTEAANAMDATGPNPHDPYDLIGTSLRQLQRGAS